MVYFDSALNKRVELDEMAAGELLSWVPPHFQFGSWEHCFYCGELPDCRDHVIPWAFLSCVVRDHPGDAWGMRTPACSDCNHVLSSHMFDTMHLRCDALRSRLTTRLKRFIKMPPWTRDEFNELSGTLKHFVKSRQEMRNVAVKRIGWQDRPEFIEMFEAAYNEARYLHPCNKGLLSFMKPSWIH